MAVLSSQLMNLQPAGRSSRQSHESAFLPVRWSEYAAPAGSSASG